MRLAGADAVNLIVGALATKDLVYLTKIAASLQMQTMLTVTSAAQVENLNALSANSIDGIIVSNRNVSEARKRSYYEIALFDLSVFLIVPSFLA